MRNLTKEIVTQMAYLIGIYEDKIENRYEKECAEVLNRIKNNKNARIIRILCMIRTAMMYNYERIDSKIRYEMKNIDHMEEYINPEDVKWLIQQSVPVIQINTPIDKYIIKINELIRDKISSCKPLFPDWIRWEYIQDLFVIPNLSNYNDKTVKALKSERNVYMKNIPLYPFQVYIHWKPYDCGNFLSTDKKFLTVLYMLHDSKFDDNDKVMDANNEIKENIYDFIDKNDSTAIIVDCENSNVYKLYSVLVNLDAKKMSKIKKIILYDDYHTTKVWKLLEKLTKLSVEHVEIERVSDRKSLVDISMTAGVCREFYYNKIQSFILVSSDSDFWGLISSLPDADFLVMIEYDKCGERIKSVFRENNIYYCPIDDFCRGNIEEIKNLALKMELKSRLDAFNETGIWFFLDSNEFIDDILKACRIEFTPAERKQFVSKYINKLQFKPDSNGKFCVKIQD